MRGLVGVCISQYLSIRYSDRLAEVGFNASVGRVGDSYDNALAETIMVYTKQRTLIKTAPGVVRTM